VTADPSEPTTTEPPLAPRRPHTWHRPGGDVDDHFAWMRATDDPALLAYLAAENDHARRWFEPHEATIEEVYAEIRSRIQETDLSTPVQYGPWWYVASTVEGLDYPIHHRGPDRESATDATLLDENVEAEGHEFFDLGAFDVSPDHELLAWSHDTKGDEHYTLRIRDLSTMADRPTRITDVSNAGVAWSLDAGHLFYVTPDEQERPSKVWRHRLGTDPGDDVCVYEETDERFFVGVATTRSDRWIVIHAGSKTSAEARLIPADEPTAEPRVVLPRRDDVEYAVDHWGDVFTMVTNDGALDFEVRAAPVAGAWATAEAWTELVPHRPGRRILAAEAFEGHLVVHEWRDAQPRLWILFRDGTTRDIDLGGEPHDVELSANEQWRTDVVRYATQSMTTPPTIYEEDVRDGTRTLLRRIPTPNVDLDRYVSTRLWATSSGGSPGDVAVPIDIVHDRDTPLDGTAPGVLYGYGAYEVSLPPWFSVARLSLLDRGFVFALAHPRGGGELGRRWYLDGKLEAKQNTFTDTLACAARLVDDGIVAAHRLAIRGGSAGGLLVGACVTQRPDLFAAAVADVPFVDVVSTMSDPSLPLTVTEWEEWGDPRAEPFASCIAAYAPYDNTRPAAYPAIYVTAGLNDPRVSVHEPAKWVARLREVATGEAPIVLRTEMEAGHGGPSGRYDAWRDEARTLTFLLATV
jgi:oligopeptidase B